jgi:hypothetical protein
MKKIAIALYQYFLIRKLPTPYFRTIMVLVGFCLLHAILLFSILPIPQNLSPFGNNKREIRNWIPTGIFIGILYLILSLIFRKSYLGKKLLAEKERKRHLHFLTIYIIIIAVILVLCSIYRFKIRL